MGRLRFKPWAAEYMRESKIVINAPVLFKGKWSEFFGNDNPIQIEVGMGKGQFIETLAVSNKDINYLGIEKYPSVQVLPVKRIEVKEGGQPNLRFISKDATDINEWFDNKSVDNIYINFPDPWPKDRHSKRRLVSNVFLDKFFNILKQGNTIEFKSDQKPLYEFALEELSERKNKWEIIENFTDLHNKREGEIVKTEYESKFTALGNPIYKITIRKI